MASIYNVNEDKMVDDTVKIVEPYVSSAKPGNILQRVQSPSITIEFEDGSRYSFTLSQDARRRVRYSFNPSGLLEVNILKALAAGFITECDHNMKGTFNSDVQNELAKAKFDMQSASMFSVAAVTTPKTVFTDVIHDQSGTQVLEQKDAKEDKK